MKDVMFMETIRFGNTQFQVQTSSLGTLIWTRQSMTNDLYLSADFLGIQNGEFLLYKMAEPRSPLNFVFFHSKQKDSVETFFDRRLVHTNDFKGQYAKRHIHGSYLLS